MDQSSSTKWERDAPSNHQRSVHTVIFLDVSDMHFCEQSARCRWLVQSYGSEFLSNEAYDRQLVQFVIASGFWWAGIADVVMAWRLLPKFPSFYQNHGGECYG